jgi:hypothetical protein
VTLREVTGAGGAAAVVALTVAALEYFAFEL